MEGFEEGKRLSEYVYAILIGILSVIMLTILPMLSSVIDLEWQWPNSPAGWVVWCLTKLTSALFNVLIFHCFVQQGKLNIKNHEKYQQAIKMLYDVDGRLQKKPKSPVQFYRDMYGKKGVMIFATTILGSIGLAQAILTFNLNIFIVQATTLVMGLIFGVMAMKNTENYWTDTYYDYAIYKKEQLDVSTQQHGIQESTGTSTEE